MSVLYGKKPSMPKALLMIWVKELPMSIVGQGTAAEPRCARRSATCIPDRSAHQPPTHHSLKFQEQHRLRPRRLFAR